MGAIPNGESPLTLTASFDTDQADIFLLNEVVKRADGITASSNTCNYSVW
jgi:hypothetical protein